jgi:hypothetical protein
MLGGRRKRHKASKSICGSEKTDPSHPLHGWLVSFDSPIFLKELISTIASFNLLPDSHPPFSPSDFDTYVPEMVKVLSP